MSANMSAGCAIPRIGPVSEEQLENSFHSLIALECIGSK